MAEDLLRVVLTGAESTGKTTLAKALSAHYRTVWAPEYLRLFVERKGSLPEESDTRLIVRGHLEQEERLLPFAYRVLILDTDLVSTCLYHRYFFGAVPPEIKAKAAARTADLYLLMDTDIPWIPDPGQRDGPEVRNEIHLRFVETLQVLPHVLISGTFEDRLATATHNIDDLLKRHKSAM